MFGYRACCCVSCLLLCILVPINILWPKYLWFRYLVLEELPGTLTSLPPYLNCWIQLSFFLKVLLVFFPATLGIQPSITKMTYSSWLKPGMSGHLWSFFGPTYRFIFPDGSTVAQGNGEIWAKGKLRHTGDGRPGNSLPLSVMAALASTVTSDC